MHALRMYQSTYIKKSAFNSKLTSVIFLSLRRDSQPSTSRSVYEDSDEHRASTSSSLSWSRQLSERKRKSEKHHTDPSDSVVSASKKKKIDSKDSVEAASRHDNDSSIHKRLWVAPNLRVRVVDTAFRGGKFYNSKVRKSTAVHYLCAESTVLFVYATFIMYIIFVLYSTF